MRIPRSADRPQRRCRQGAAAVELALILPLLVTIVLGCVDFGRFASTYISVTNAARAGAGYAGYNPFTITTQPLWEALVTQAVVDDIQDMPGFDASKLSVTIQSVNDPNSLKRVRVQASYSFEMIFSWPLLPNSISLTRAVEMPFIR